MFLLPDEVALVREAVLPHLRPGQSESLATTTRQGCLLTAWDKNLESRNFFHVDIPQQNDGVTSKSFTHFVVSDRLLSPTPDYLHLDGRVYRVVDQVIEVGAGFYQYKTVLE
jgi:hypothetical protein